MTLADLIERGLDHPGDNARHTAAEQRATSAEVRLAAIEARLAQIEQVTDATDADGYYEETGHSAAQVAHWHRLVLDYARTHGLDMDEETGALVITTADACAAIGRGSDSSKNIMRVLVAERYAVEMPKDGVRLRWGVLGQRAETT